MKSEDESAFKGSAVMRAGTIVDFEELLDELEFRLMRCASGLGTSGSALRKGGVLAAGEYAHRIARNEMRCFWNEHRLAAWATESLVNLLNEILERPPRYLAWSLVPLLTELAPALVSKEIVERVVDWVTSGEPVERVVRDAVTMTILVKWLSSCPEEDAVRQLVALCDSVNTSRVRIGCIGLGAYLRDPTVTLLRAELVDIAFAACIKASTYVDAETSLAVGWALRELLAREPDRLSVVLEKRIQSLSRQTFRTAVERLSPEVRARLTERWLAKRKGRRLLDKGSHAERSHRNRSIS